MTEEQSTFEQWAIVELMGHVRMAGRVTEEERFGIKLGRIDIPRADGTAFTQYFGGSSVYRITPTTEEIARAVAAHNEQRPVQTYELPRPVAPIINDSATYDDSDAYDRTYDDSDDDDAGF